jgi:predicted secreted protein
MPVKERRHRPSAWWVAGTLAAALGILTAGCGSGERPPARPRGPSTGANRPGDITTFDAGTTTISVRPEQRFQIAFRQNPSIGDNWQIRQPPASTVIAPIGTTYVPDHRNGPPGTGGTLYLSFDAGSPGHTTMSVRNCWRADSRTCAVRPGDARWAPTVRFTMVVEAPA